MIRTKIRVVVCLCLVATSQPVFAQNQPKGHINNIDGENCTFTQTTTSESHLQSLPANTGHLVFDDPTCMSAEGLNNDVNQMMIANFVTRRYGQPDASFQTRSDEFRSGSSLQVQGICIQSATYQGVGVVADFLTSGGHIVGVKHAMAVQGCSN